MGVRGKDVCTGTWGVKETIHSINRDLVCIEPKGLSSRVQCPKHTIVQSSITLGALVFTPCSSPVV